MSTPPQYKSDRWVTPGVVIVGLLVAAGVVLGVTAAVAWVSVRGVDPGPVLQLVGILVAAAGSAGSFLLQLVNRRTVTKTERNTGVLANAVLDVSDSVSALQATPPAAAPVAAPVEELEPPTAFAASYERPPVPAPPSIYEADDYPTACGGRLYREPRIAR